MQRKSLVYLSWLFLSTSSFAAGCSANGENGSTCSIDCAQGQEALCIPGSGGNDPQCLCTGAAEYLQGLKGKRDRVIGAIKKKLLAKRLGNIALGLVDVDYKMKFNKKNK